MARHGLSTLMKSVSTLSCLMAVLFHVCVNCSKPSRFPHPSAQAEACNHRLADTVKGDELRYTILAMEREQIACSSLLRLLGAVLADPEPMPVRLVRGCIALAFAACVPARNHRLADDTVQGNELGYTILAMEREQIAYSALLRRPDTAHADPTAMPPRPIRSRLA